MDFAWLNENHDETWVLANDVLLLIIDEGETAAEPSEHTESQQILGIERYRDTLGLRRYVWLPTMPTAKS